MISNQSEQDRGRAKNALQDFLIRKLIFPKVYLDALWNGKKVDVLAIDHEGAGDLHAVYIVYQGSDPENALDIVFANIETHSMPHFIYVAVVNDGSVSTHFVPTERIIKKSLAEDGVGRVGILYVDLSIEVPAVKEILKAERFRSSKEIVNLADEFVATHTPNWEIRD